MSKEKFNWKGLFVNDVENSNTTPEKDSATQITSFPKETKTSSTKFPEHTSQRTATPISSVAINNSILETIVEMYESGFESLNMPGYDFYEFFKSIKAAGSNNASVYKMALSMAQSVDSKVNKASLLEGSNFYINEIDKVHKQYSIKGNAKRDQIQGNQIKEKEKLTYEITTLEEQIIELQTKISKKKIQLESADSSLLNEIAEIEQKIVANDMAKEKIQETIITVVNGIKNNL